ncbi:GMC family oxidoreductase [Alphaproteobacteria bacterium]|nr:GMC family oxidoreductase [Alphaproteobacteria bacterium]
MINLINSNNFNSEQAHETDILIVGSGINCLSFIEFFNEFNQSNKRITVIEKGEINKDLFKNERADLNISTNPDNFQNQGMFEFHKKGMNQSVSGNSPFWGGRFTRLDKEDFIKREWLDNDKEWPFSYEEYDEIINDIYKFYRVDNNKNFDLYHYFSKKHLIKSHNLENKIFFIKFINFYYHLNQKINSIKNIDIFFNAEVEKLNFHNESINSINIINKNLKLINIKTQKIILSAGVLGNIENLLKFKRNSNLIDSKNIVGRYVMNHPSGKILEFKNNNKVFSSMYFGSNFLSLSYRYGIKGSFDFQKKNQITNSLLLFQPYHFLNKYKFSDIYKWSKRKFTANFDKKVNLNLYLEMLPDINNKIDLIDNNLKINVNIDKHAYHNTEVLITELLNYFGYIKKDMQKIIENIYLQRSFEDSYHYIGGTIMGDDKKESVVNKDLKHHEIDNLYVLGASTFPKSGHANPVATQLFLSYRLAKHLYKP